MGTVLYPMHPPYLADQEAIIEKKVTGNTCAEIIVQPGL